MSGLLMAATVFIRRAQKTAANDENGLRRHNKQQRLHLCLTDVRPELRYPRDKPFQTADAFGSRYGARYSRVSIVSA